MAKKVYKTQTEQVAAKMPLLVFIPAAIFVVLVILILIFKTGKLGDNDAVATVDGYEVSAVELSDAMSREKANAFSAFEEKYGVGIATADLDTEIKGVVPRDFIRDYAFNKLCVYKVEQALGVKYKLLTKEEASYKSFLDKLSSENSSRSQKIAAGEVVYGARQYTKNSFFSYTYSNLQLDIQKKISENGEPLFISEKQLKAWYESVKEKRYSKQDKISFSGYVLYYEGSEQNKGYSQDEARSVMKKVKAALDKGKSDAEIKGICKDLISKKLSIDDESASSLQKEAYNVFEAVNSLQKGQISEVVEDGFSFAVVRCISREKDGFKDFSEYKDSIHTECVSEKYEQYVNEKVESAKVEKLDGYTDVE